MATRKPAAAEKAKPSANKPKPKPEIKAKPAPKTKPKPAAKPKSKPGPEAKTPPAAKKPRAPRLPRTLSVPEPEAPPTTRVGYVALIGRPNVGKSTLLNRIIGQKISIISDKPQTTRISILGIHTTDKGQIIFIDNPGIHKPLHHLNKRMMNFVYASLETADIVCLMIDATEKFGHGDEFVLETMRKVSKPVFLLINKVDIVRKDVVLLLIDRYKDILPFKEIIPISAATGTNVDVLERLLFDHLPLSPKLYGDEDVTDQSRRFLLAEIIREKVLAHVEKELPWVTAVYIDAMEKRNPDGSVAAEDAAAEFGGEPDVELAEGEAPSEYTPPQEVERFKKPAPEVIIPKSERRELREPVTYIKASIFVERDNHRKIIIGRQGKTIRQIGIEARREIQDILESRIYLDLRVRVRPGFC
ncbi:MAG: GTPase Era [Candidatus Aminicenantes bacterium]|nr:GTPase Era [Candidatus Aminicenantes bacterium]